MNNEQIFQDIAAYRKALMKLKQILKVEIETLNKRIEEIDKQKNGGINDE